MEQGSARDVLSCPTWLDVDSDGPPGDLHPRELLAAAQSDVDMCGSWG